MSKAMKAMPLVVLCALIVAVPSVWANWVQDGVAICTALDHQGSPQITSDGAGGAIVTWMDNRVGAGYADIYAQRVNASGAVQWTANGVVLCTAAGIQEYPQIIFDGAGGAIVTWMDQRSGAYDIYAQKVNASGAAQWTTDGVALCTATGDQESPQIVSDGAGGAIVTWWDSRSGNWDIYAQRVNASGAVQWTTDGVALCTAPGDQERPQIISNGAGGAIVTWMDFRSGNWGIYVQRVNASGAVQWTTDGVPMGPGWYPTITSDGAGGAIVTWAGNLNRNYAQRVDASGAVQWTTGGVGLCTATGLQYSPMITSDGAGGAIVAWMDDRNGTYDIYAQRVDVSGGILWRTDGVAICTATGHQWPGAIISDGAGGAIATWTDYRSGASDIYAQKVNASGTVRWTTDGGALCTAMGSQMYPTITSDGWGGAIVTWQDSRSGSNSHIYALRVDANGFALLTGTDAPAVPIELQQNYPNPFNPTTTMTYSVPERCNVALKIYDVSGKCVARLVDKEQEKGSYTVAWNGKDETGSSVASGIYLYRLSAGNQTIARKMVLLR